MLSSPILPSLLLLTVVSIAVFTDVQSRRIPNLLCAAAFLAGVVLQATAGRAGLLQASLGCGLALLIYVPLFALQAFGAGDVKLMAALGVILGPTGWLWLFLATSIIGGVLAVASAALTGRLRVTVWNTVALLGCLSRFQFPAKTYPELSVRERRGATLPHAIPIAIAAGIYVCLH